jgi:hypothetical protein
LLKRPSISLKDLVFRDSVPSFLYAQSHTLDVLLRRVEKNVNQADLEAELLRFLDKPAVLWR